MTQTRAAQLYSGWDRAKVAQQQAYNARRCENNPSCNGQDDTTAWMAAQRAKALADERNCERNPLCGSNGVVDYKPEEIGGPNNTNCQSWYCDPRWKNINSNDNNSNNRDSETLTNFQKIGMVVTVVLLDVVLLAIESMIFVAMLAAAGAGIGGALLDVFILFPVELLLFDLEIGVNKYVYDVVTTGTRQGHEMEFYIIIPLIRELANQK
jgi:hypothetical protein